jgi:hypothetical protein
MTSSEDTPRFFYCSNAVRTHVLPPAELGYNPRAQGKVNDKLFAFHLQP